MVLTKEQLKATWASSPTDIKFIPWVIPTQAPVINPATNWPMPEVTSSTQTIAPVVTPTISPVVAPNEMNTKTVTPTVAPVINETVTPTTQETNKTIVTNKETPNWTITTTETPKTWITKDTQWENTWKTLSDLEQMVEARYWTVATQNPDWTITAIVWDKKYQWNIWADWKPSKTEVWLSQTDKYKQSFLNKYWNAWVDSLYNAFVNWEIPSDMQWDLIWNPNYTIAKEKFEKKLSTDATNNQMENIYNATNWKETTIVDKWTELNNKLVNLLTWMWKTETDLVSFRDYMYQNYPELVSQTQDLNSKNKRLKELSEVANKNLRDIEKNYPWLPKWSAILLANKTNEAINDEIRWLQFDISELSSNIQFQTNMADKDYTNLQNKQDRQDKLDAEKRGYAFDMINTAQQQDFQTKQAETQFNRSLYAQELQNKYQDSKDVQNFNQELKKMWIQNAYNIDTNKLNFEQQKQLTALQNKYSNSKDVQNYNQELAKMKYASELNTKANIDEMTAKYNLENPTTPVLSWNLSTEKINGKNITMDTNALASFKNAIANMPWTVIWNQQYRTPEEQKALVDKWVSWTLNSKHMTWEAVDIYANNKLQKPTAEQVKTMNENWWYQPAETIAKWDYGHFEYLWKQIQATWKQYSDEQISDLAYVTELLEKTPTEWRKALKEMWYTDKDIANYKAWNIPLTEKQKNSSFEVVNWIKDLISNYDWNDAVGKFDYSRVLWLQGAEDAKIVIDNLVAKLTLPNLWVLKWPMSDKDIEFIKAASSKLWTTQSNKSFEKNLIDAYNIAARRAWIKEVETLNEIKNWTSNINTTWTWWRIKWATKGRIK